MGYPRCFEVDRDKVEERRDNYYGGSSYDSNFNYNMNIARARSTTSKPDLNALPGRRLRGDYVTYNGRVVW